MQRANIPWRRRKRRRRLLAGSLLFASAIAATSVFAAAPLQYLSGHGDKADATVPLTWAVTIVSIAVVAIISLLVAGAIWRRPGIAAPAPGVRLAVAHPGGINWVWIGVGVSTIVLLVTVVWTMVVLAQVGTNASDKLLTIEITGHQWWWQARYLSNDPSRVFSTANEIHIPTGERVRFKLIGADVIHSFWVPALGGKTDTIPGQTNETWLQAREPGTYRGQCTEYCGVQHAKMGFLVIAQSPADFRNWFDNQLRSPQPVGGQAALGQAEFNMHCGSCHAVRGTDAGGFLGPDLSHFMNRHTIAAAMLPNDDADLDLWISDPQSIKPGNLMPKPEITRTELSDIHAYLKTLN